MQTKDKWDIGLVYIGSTEPFSVVRVEAGSRESAISRGLNYLKPNHLQTLTINKVIGPTHRHL